MKMKKVLAVVMAFCMVAGTVSYGAPIITQPITAQAVDMETYCYSFDEETGVLTLRGTVDRGALVEFSDNCKDLVKSVVVEKGTVFPKDSSGLFKGYKNCTTIDLSNANTSNVFFMQSMFEHCVSLKSIDLSGFDTSKVTCMSSMFEHCESLESIDLSGFDTSKVTCMPFMFGYCESLVTLDLSGFDTRNVTEMSYLFTHCSSLTKLDLSGFDTGKVIHMSGMFCFNQHLTELDVSGFDTKNVTSMSSMFACCSFLSELDVSGFDTCSLVYASSMFFGCSGLTSLDVSGFDTSKVMYMAAMFYGCSGLTSLDVSGFDTGNVTTMNSMFFGCSELTSLDISNFDTSKVTYMDDMFTDCNNLKTLKIGKNFNIIKADAKLPNGEGWVNANAPTTVISGDGEYAVIKNSGKNTYKRLPITILTYPTNIKVEYNEKYQQVRFTWDKVRGADKYCLAVYQAGKWKVQTQNITDTVYTSPKNLTQGMTYKVAISARVNGKWDTANAIKKAVTIVKIPYASEDTDGDGIINAKDNQPNQKNNYPSVLVDYINKGIVDMNYTEETNDDFVICKTPLSEILSSCGVNTITDNDGNDLPVNEYYDDWYIMALNRNGKETYGLYKMREQEYDSDDNNVPGVTISFVEFDISKLNDVIYHNTSNTSDLYNEIDRVVHVPDAPYSPELQSYFANGNSEAPYLIAEAYVDKIANSYSISSIPFPDKLNEIYTKIAIINAEIIVAMINSRKDVPILLAKKAELNKVPNALTDCNKNFGSIIADENTRTIQITSSSNLDYNEKRAILSAYTADTSFNMFAAEVQFHAEYLDDGLISDLVYSHVIHADMTIDQSTTDYLTDTYHNPNDSRVVAQSKVHGNR